MNFFKRVYHSFFYSSSPSYESESEEENDPDGWVLICKEKNEKKSIYRLVSYAFVVMNKINRIKTSYIIAKTISRMMRIIQGASSPPILAGTVLSFLCMDGFMLYASKLPYFGGLTQMNQLKRKILNYVILGNFGWNVVIFLLSF